MFVLLDVVHSHAAANSADEASTCSTAPRISISSQPGRSPRLGHQAVQLRQASGAAFPAFQPEILARGIPFRRLPLRRRYLHALSRPRPGGTASRDYYQYFSLNTNVAAVTYLQLANDLVHSVNPFAITIAEDMSGMPGMCLPVRGRRPGLRLPAGYGRAGYVDSA